MSVFDERAKEWDKPDRVKMAELISLCILAGLNPKKDMVGVDFGAGTGLVTIEIAKRVKHITAIDSSEGMLGILREKISVNGITNISTAAVEIELGATGFKELDFIVSSMAIHHVKNIKTLAEAFYSMLKSDGKIALADLDKEDGTFHSQNPVGVWHRGFDRKELTDIFSKVGFKNIKFTTAHNIPRKSETGEIKLYPVFLLLAEK
jgi:ubiquinone/menaquinone biosynthesis C-methylase UbiE